MKGKYLHFSLLLIPVLAALLWTGLVKGSPVETPPGPSGPEDMVTTLYATKDTYVSEEYPDTNFGDSQYLVVGRVNGDDRDIMLQFDLSVLPPDAVVTSATLELRSMINKGEAAVIETEYTAWVGAVALSWFEMGATWNNAPPMFGYGDPPTTIPENPNGYVAWDVTNIVQAWVGGAQTNYGFRMYGDRSAEGQASFFSREDWFVPQLTIAYTSTLVTPTPTPLPTDTPPDTPTPTPPGGGSCPGAVYVYADQDTYVTAQFPELELGDWDYLWIQRESENPQEKQINMFLHFPIEAVLPPGTNIYQATVGLRVSGAWGDASPTWRTGVSFSLDEPFDEDTTNWNNQPGIGSHMKDFDISSESGWHTIDVTSLVRDWYTGAEPNYGIGVYMAVPLTGTYAVEYYSRNYDDTSYRPRLEIQCGDETITPTPTPSPSPTRTPTATPTITPTPVPTTSNVEAYRLEVTQGLQGLDGSIPLLEGKRTYVRLHYNLNNPLPDYAYITTAKLNIYRSGVWQVSVWPINPGGQIMLLDQSYPWLPHNTFIFELPSEYTDGDVHLQAVIDPNQNLPESNIGDNIIYGDISFEPAQSRDLYLYLVRYTAEDGTVSVPDLGNVAPSWSYAMSALPFTTVNSHVRILEWDEATMGEMNCETVNGYLLSYWLADGASWSAIYYGIMPGNRDGRSCAYSIPSPVASSWENTARETMAHELGHCFGRHHTQNPKYDDGGAGFDIGCGAKTGCVYWFGILWGCPDGFEEYPYSNGQMSPHTWGFSDFYGFYDNPYITDFWQEFMLPDYTWKDLMTYCLPNWPSDFTWKNIYDDWFSINAQRALELEQPAQITPTDSLVVVGTIYSRTGTVDMQQFYVLPDVTWAPEPTPGDFAIVLYDASNTELLRHEFTPGLVDVEDFGNVLSVGEMVPYVDGTVQVDIEGPSGILHRVTSGAAPPTVTVVRPNGGESLTGSGEVLVTWTASDPDGDPLTFNVQYSDDNGATWKLLAADVISNSVWIDAGNISGSERGYVRILASDGIHTAYDTSDGPFTVPNHRPSAKIVTPMEGDIYIVSQTVGLEARVHDVEDGSLDPAHVRWYSSQDGVVGTGSQVSLADLSAGQHTLFLVVWDSDGATDSDTVQITVYASLEDMPPMPDMLRAEPGMVVLDALIGAGSRPIHVYNHSNSADPISWTASASEPWVHLSATSGTTADIITVWASTLSMPEGPYTATVTFTNDADPTDSSTVHLSIQARKFPIYLPVVTKDYL